MLTFATHDSSNINLVFAPNLTSQDSWELAEFQFHLATKATASNSLMLQKRSKRGSQYDTVILVQPMVSVGDVLWQPDHAIKFNGRDRLAITWTNDAASFKTWGLEAHYIVR